MCEKYRASIETILEDADLSTITQKSIRLALESETGTSLNPIKKEINALIGEIFLNIQKQQEKSLFVVSKTANTKSKVKKTTPATIKKPVQKKKKDVKEKRVIDWPLLKVSPPLSDIIHTNLCSRPQTVKRMWEYIKEHGLQLETDRRTIKCDDKLKELCDGNDEVSAFSINKFTQKCFTVIPKEEQPKYKQLLLEKGGHKE